MKNKHKRLLIIIVSLALAILGISLVITEFRENIIFFYSPSEIPNQVSHEIRIGGFVKQNSLKQNINQTIEHEFLVTDQHSEITVYYKGILPDLFREGQGVVAKGYLVEGKFQANEILAKHDENYTPKELHNLQD